MTIRAVENWSLPAGGSAGEHAARLQKRSSIVMAGVRAVKMKKFAYPRIPNAF
jgi:hypothetical protein